MSAPDALLQDVRDSDTYDEWQRQLIDCFYEEEEKDELIRSLRAYLDDRYDSLDPEELDALKKEVVSSLVATAAQEAERPEPDSSPSPAYEPDQWSPPSDLEVSWSLLDVMRAPTQQADEDESEAALSLKDGLQRALTALVCTFLADAIRLDEIPPRLTSYFASGLVQPTPGKLLDRLRWAAFGSFSSNSKPPQGYPMSPNSNFFSKLHYLT